ncbi:MAG: ATP-binding protein, partial [Prochloraceae cyanobacterium]
MTKDAIANTILQGNGNIIIFQASSRQEVIEKEEQIQTDNAIGSNPYKGLLSFDEQDCDRYFGREAQINKFWEEFAKIYQQDKLPRLLPILGPSGCGKSSLARAGLIPELVKRPLLGLKSWKVIILKPGVRPLESLADVLARVASNDLAPFVTKSESFLEILESKRSGEWAGLRRIAGNLPEIDISPLIVFVDQFEEVYSLCQDIKERNAFINNLLHAASDCTKRVSVIFTLQSDFLAEIQKQSQFNKAIGKEDFNCIVTAMEKEELTKAIARPAKNAGYPLDSGTVQLLIEQTKGRQGALPLLQFALAQIWDSWREGISPAETLEKIGGVGGALAGVAQKIFNSLDEQEKEIAKRLFLELVNVGEEGQYSRCRIEVRKVVGATEKFEQVKKVIDKFASNKARLISLSINNKENQIAEVTHEALFTNWDQFNRWLEESRKSLIQKQKIDSAATEWEINDKSRDYLWQGERLNKAKKFAKNNLEKFPL